MGRNGALPWLRHIAYSQIPVPGFLFLLAFYFSFYFPPPPPSLFPLPLSLLLFSGTEEEAVRFRQSLLRMRVAGTRSDMTLSFFSFSLLLFSLTVLLPPACRAPRSGADPTCPPALDTWSGPATLGVHTLDEAAGPSRTHMSVCAMYELSRTSHKATSVSGRRRNIEEEYQDPSQLQVGLPALPMPQIPTWYARLQVRGVTKHT